MELGHFSRLVRLALCVKIMRGNQDDVIRRANLSRNMYIKGGCFLDSL